MNTSISKCLRVTLLIMASCMVASCGTKLGYNLIDRMILWRVDGYLDLDREQKSLLKEQVQGLHDWHRNEVLPQHIAQLRALSAAIESDRLDQPLVSRTTDELIKIWQAAMQRLSPIAVDVLIDLRPEQVERLIDKLREDIEDDQQTLADKTPEERIEQRAENLEDFFDKWWGSLRPEQTLRIQQTAEQLQDLSQMELDHRRAWLQRFESAMAVRHGPRAPFAARIEQLFVEPEQWWSPAYRAANKANDQQRVLLTVDLAASMDARQKAHVLDELNDLTEDLLDLVDD